MRKVLSFVLVLTLVLSSFSMAFAAEATATTVAAAAGLSDISASANAQAIEVANNLGIITGNPDGTFQPEKAVNRAEFAAMITRALGIPQSALAGYTSTSFKDTTGYGWAVSYLAFCQSKGIMLGDGNGNAMPGRTINTNEAATMVLRALGYTANSSALIGTWPSNYVSLAQDLGIYDSTAKATNVDKQNAAQMIYNALSVQKVQVAADGTTTQLKDSSNNPVTMLTSGLGCTSNGYGVITYDENAVINTIGHIGEYGKTYDNADGNMIAIDDVQSTALTGKFKDVDASGTLTAGDTFKADGVTYTIDKLTYDDDENAATAPVAYKQFVNGDDTAITFVDGATYTFNVRLSNKNTAELFSVAKWTANAAAKIVAGDLESIKDGSFLGYDFATDKNDNIIAKSFQLVGVASLSDIKANSVVYVYEDATRDEISKVTVGTAVVEGKVTKVNPTDKEWTVGGKAYKFGLNGTNGSSAYANKLNDDVKLFLDAKGDIYKYDVTSGAAKDYAVIVNWDTSGTNDGTMKLYLADDSKKTLASDFDEWAWVKVNANNTDNGHRLVGYGVDKNGVIDGVYPQTAGDAGAWVTGASVFKSNAVVTMGGTDRTIDADVVVFTEDNSGVVNGVAKIADVDKNSAAIAGVEGLVRDGKIVALIVNENAVSGSGDSQYAVVSGVDSAVNPAGDKALSLKGFIDGKKIADDSAYTSGTSTVTSSGNGNGYEAVNVYKIKYNDDKNISKMDPLTGAAVALGTAGGSGATITANGYTSDGYLKTGAGAGTITAVAPNATYYEVVFETKGNDASGVKEYKLFNGTIYSGMKAWAFDTDSDTDGADIVIIDKGNISTYAPTVTLGSASLAATSPAAATTSAVLSGFVGTVTASTSYANLTASYAGGVLTLTPAAGCVDGTVTVSFTDDTGNSVTKNVTLDVTGY